MPCAIKIWVFPRQHLQAPLPVIDHPHSEKLSWIGKPVWPCLQIVSSCLLCTTEWPDITSALPLLFSRLNQRSTLCLPSYALCSSPNCCKDILWSPGRICIFLLILYIASLYFSLLSWSLWITRKWYPGKDAKEWRTSAGCQGDHTDSMHHHAGRWVWAEDSCLCCQLIEN